MTDNIQDKLNLLLARYAANLPTKIHALEAHWFALQNEMTPTRLLDFHREIHSLCGSSATYGYHTLSHAARRLEKYLSVIIEKNIRIGEIETHEINLLMQTMVSSTEPDTMKHRDSLSFSLNPVIENRYIYLLDDDAKVALALKEKLDESGFVLHAQKNMTNLVQALEKHSPLAIIVDIDALNENDISQLMDQRKRQIAPVSTLFISNHGDLITRLKAVRAGGVSFYQKPVDWFQVGRVLDQLSESAVNEPYRILIVDDSLSLAEYHALILQEAGMITAIETKPLDIMKQIVDFQPDLLLMDIYMPDCSGLEVAAVLRQQPLYTSLPIIFLSTEDDRIKQLSALNVGGDDFLAKPILPQHLVSAVRSRAKRSGILSSFMIRDSLTELLNHTTTLQQLMQELKRAEQQSNELSLVILDIDHFKAINDTYGHPMGDYVLRKLAELLLSQLRKSDIVGRYGGDEFAIILPNTNKDVSVQLCNRICEHFSRLIFKSEDVDFPVSFSMGIASYPHFKDADSLINAADKSLYQAKKMGRNRVVHAEDKH